MADAVWARRLRRPGDVVVRRGRVRPERIPIAPMQIPRRPRSPLTLFVLSYLIATAIGTALLSLPIAAAEAHASSLHLALFTAISAVTLTGLVLVDTGTYWSSLGHVVLLGLMQFGAIAYVSGASIAFLSLGRRIRYDEQIAYEPSGVLPRSLILRVVRQVVVVTFALEAAGMVLLVLRLVPHMPADRAAWLALFHAVSAYTNTGFAMLGSPEGLGPLQGDVPALGSIALLAAVGSLGYLTLADLARARSFARLSVDSKLVLTTSVLLWLVGMLAIAVAEWRNTATLGPLPLPAKLVNALFLSVSARSAGFSPVSVSELTDHTLVLLIGLMFIGGASGSTAGGIRLNTFSVLLAAIVATVLGRREVHVYRRTIPQETINRALAIALLGLAIAFVSAYVLATFEPAPFLPLLFESVSAFGTTGLTASATPSLSALSSTLIMLGMILGRFGPLAIVLVLVGRVRVPRVQFAEEVVRIG